MKKEMSEATGRRDTVRILERTPVAPLRPFVERLRTVEFPARYRDMHLPDVRPVAAFSLSGECLLGDGRPAPPAAFTGVHTEARFHEHGHHHAVLLVTFTPIGAAARLREPLEGFTGTTTDLAAALGRPGELDRLRERFHEAADDHRRIAHLEAFLLDRLGDAVPDPLIAAAAAWLQNGNGSGRRIDALTQYIGLSQSALERRFRRVVGISPKRFASLVRLQTAVRMRTDGDGADFADVARAAGYFDQSHFIQEFRRATGSTPARYFGHAPSPAGNAEFLQSGASLPR